MNTYENAISTKMLATHCVCCGRALVDAISVELGIGPECRSGFNADLTEMTRRVANKLVFEASMAATAGLIPIVMEKAEEVRQLGYGELAERMEHRFVKAERKADIQISFQGGFYEVVTPYRRKNANAFVKAWREIPGRRWINGKNVVPATSKKELWELLQEFFGGCYAMGPKGVFKIIKTIPEQKEFKL